MQKVALFAFNGDPMCFVHVLLNALDMREKGFEVKIVIEGSATKLIPDLGLEGSPLNGLFKKVQSENLIDGVCKACAAKMGTLEDAKTMDLTLLGDMSGHPAIAKYLKDGFEVITF